MSLFPEAGPQRIEFAISPDRIITDLVDTPRLEADMRKHLGNVAGLIKADRYRAIALKAFGLAGIPWNNLSRGEFLRACGIVALFATMSGCGARSDESTDTPLNQTALGREIYPKPISDNEFRALSAQKRYEYLLKGALPKSLSSMAPEQCTLALLVYVNDMMLPSVVAATGGTIGLLKENFAFIPSPSVLKHYMQKKVPGIEGNDLEDLVRTWNGSFGFIYHRLNNPNDLQKGMQKYVFINHTQITSAVGRVFQTMKERYPKEPLFTDGPFQNSVIASVLTYIVTHEVMHFELETFRVGHAAGDLQMIREYFNDPTHDMTGTPQPHLSENFRVLYETSPRLMVKDGFVYELNVVLAEIYAAYSFRLLVGESVVGSTIAMYPPGYVYKGDVVAGALVQKFHDAIGWRPTLRELRDSSFAQRLTIIMDKAEKRGIVLTSGDIAGIMLQIIEFYSGNPNESLSDGLKRAERTWKDEISPRLKRRLKKDL